MVRKGIYRGEVWYCQLDEIGLENHLCLVISSWRNLLKSPKLQILTITSQEKEYDKTVKRLDKDKYALYKDSFVHAECIYTISKDRLIKRICKLSNLDMIEIDENIKDQLQLKNYNYLTDEEITNKFKGDNSSIKQEDLIKIKCDCYSLYKENKFQDSIDMCNKLLESTKQAKNVKKSEFNYYSYYISSLSKMKLYDYNGALEDIKQALVLIEKKDGYDQNLTVLLWNKAKCYENLGENDESLSIYESLSNYYYKHGFMILSLSCRFNECNISKDIEAMEYIIEELESLDVTHLGRYETNEYRLNVLDQMKNDIKEYNTFSKGVI